jgi:isopenicillin-N N-acyltransferase-like protein
LAHGAQIELLDAVALQCRTELAYREDGQCTSFAVLGDKAWNGHPLVGQNVDWLEVMDYNSVLLHLQPEEGPEILMYANAGLLGYPGMNSEGLVLCLNMLVSEGWVYGLPSIILMRAMLEQASIGDAEKLLARWPRSSSRNYLLADSSGEAADFECLVNSYRVLRPSDGLLAHANNFCDPEFAAHDRLEDLPDSDARCNRMYHLLREAPKPLTLETMKQLLADHANYPASVCRHPSGKPEKLPIKTNASFIADPVERVLHINAGNPCNPNWVTYSL